MIGSADYNDMMADIWNDQQEALKFIALTNSQDEEEHDESNLTFLEYCDVHNLDPEEEVFLQRVDWERDRELDR